MYRDSLIELIEEYDIDFVPHAPCTIAQAHLVSFTDGCRRSANFICLHIHHIGCVQIYQWQIVAVVLPDTDRLSRAQQINVGVNADNAHSPTAKNI